MKRRSNNSEALSKEFKHIGFFSFFIIQYTVITNSKPELGEKMKNKLIFVQLNTSIKMQRYSAKSLRLSGE